MVDEAEVERGARAQLELLERREIGVVGAALRHRQVEELDSPLHPRHDAVDDLGHDAGILRLHHVLVGRTAVAQVIAELDLARHRVADLAEHVDGLLAEIDRARLVIALPGQHFLADVPLHGDAVVRQRRGDGMDLADESLRQRRQQFRPVGRHHIVVGRRDRRRDADLEFDARGNDAGLLQPVEHGEGFDRHGGIAGLEILAVRRLAGLDAQPRDFADNLAVPLHELERRHVARQFDRRIFRKHVLQEADPALADAGLAVGQARDVAADRARQRPEHGFGIGQRNATDEMHDWRLGVLGVHGVGPPRPGQRWQNHSRTRRRCNPAS